MTVLAPFDASDVKLRRAEIHLDELRREIGAYLGGGAVRIVVETADEYNDIDEGTRAFVYREREPIPVLWSAVVGDVLHNVRAAYDLLACDVHRITGGKPEHSEHVHYPFCKVQADLNATIKKQRLHLIGRDFRDIIESTAPYRGGNNGLRAIHELDILDKHQALLPVVSIASLPWPVPIKQGPQKFTTKLETDGQRIMVASRHIITAPLGTVVDAEFTVLFGSEGPFQGQPLIGQLGNCIDYTRQVIERFRAAARRMP